MKYTVIVTGASGRVGVSVVNYLLKAGYHVYALIHSPLPSGHPLLQEKVTLMSIDLLALPEQELLNWFKLIQPIAFIHSAALADVLLCERQPERAYRMNTDVTKKLAALCARSQIHFILLSTEYVFAGTSHPEILYHEEDPVGPVNHYGKSKVGGELATQEECRDRTLWTICRTSVVYGLAYGGAQWHRPDFTQWVRMMLSQNEILSVAVDQFNSPMYAADLAKILIAVIGRKLQGIYHVAGSTVISRYGFALKVAQHYGLDETLIHPMFTREMEQEVRRPLNAGLCVDKIRRDAGLSPQTLEESLSSYQELERVAS